jgi:hypothetical protein
MAECVTREFSSCDISQRVRLATEPRRVPVSAVPQQAAHHRGLQSAEVRAGHSLSRRHGGAVECVLYLTEAEGCGSIGQEAILQARR